MKILYISHSHPPRNAILKNVGGMQRVSMQLLNELQNRPDTEVYPVILKSGSKRLGINTFFFLLKLLAGLPVMIRAVRPDVILFSSMVTASVSVFLRNVIPVPMVTINHGQDVTLPVKPYQLFLPFIFKSLDGVISVSQATREAAVERGMDPAKGVALPNGYPVSEFSPGPGKKEARTFIRDHLGVNPDNKAILLSVGRQVRRKGHFWFIDKVIPDVKSDILYILVGDGPEHDKIINLVDEKGLKQRVILAGRQPDFILEKLYAASDLFIMPNVKVPGDMEGFGIVLLEANMYGIPFIASRLEGIRDVLSEGINGFGIEPGDNKAFSAKIDAVLSDYPDKISIKCRDYVKNKFDWQVVARQYLSYLSRVIDQYNRNARSAG